jgi:integrase
MGNGKSSRGIELRTGATSESIRIKFMYRGMECRESLRLAHTKANINYATRLRGEILNAIERNSFNYAEFFPDSKTAAKFFDAPARVLIGDLLKTYMLESKKALSVSTVRGYQQVCDSHLFEQWGNTPITELKPPALRAWIASLDCKIKTLRNILTPLRNVLEQAINDDLIESNPLDRVKLTKLVPREALKSDHVTDPFDMQEIKAILAACDGQERNLYQFAFASGLRTSELIALEWRHIDFLKLQCSVEQVKVEKVLQQQTKTDAGRRKVNLTSGAYDALQAQREHTQIIGKWVFHDARYKTAWADDQAVKKRWMIILRKAGVRYRNPYQTRHTFASTLLSMGTNALYVSKQMGHEGTEMLNRTYGRWIEQGSEPDKKDGFSEFFAQQSPTVFEKSSKSL